MLFYVTYHLLLAVRRGLRRLRGSLRPPQDIPPPATILHPDADPDTVRQLLDRAQLEKRHLLEASNALDRKLPAVITAGGVYIALLASTRGLIPGWMIGITGFIAVTGVILAYLAWRPNLITSSTALAECVDKDSGNLQQLLVAIDNSVNQQRFCLNEWKALLFARASTCVSVSALITLLISILGGLL